MRIQCVAKILLLWWIKQSGKYKVKEEKRGCYTED